MHALLPPSPLLTGRLRALRDEQHGNPNGVNVEWLITHPKAPYLYAFVSYWDHASGECVTFSIGAQGALDELARTKTLGFQAAHAELLPTDETYRTLAVSGAPGLTYSAPISLAAGSGHSSHCGV